MSQEKGFSGESLSSVQPASLSESQEDWVIDDPVTASHKAFVCGSYEYSE